MSGRMLFINLPVQDLGRARDFYEALGHRVHEGFSDETSVAVVIDDSIVVVLCTAERFAGLVAGGAGDPARTTTAVHCLTAGTREEVDAAVSTALDAGGRPWLPAREDGLRYVGSYTDPEGNPWEVMWLDQLHVVN
jgi:predicted lactoylglutathione lyase